jgi:hypothetical protein
MMSSRKEEWVMKRKTGQQVGKRCSRKQRALGRKKG